jgi:adenine deaminase
MIENAKLSPMHFFFGLPSCVPASPFEKSGAVLNASDIERLIKEDDFFFLAEMMNYPGVVFNDPDVHAKLNAAKAAHKPIDGHAPSVTGEWLTAYAKAGISTDHECSTLEEAIEKINLGMKILVREGSAAKNFDSLVGLLKDYPNSVMFCTDDCHPDYLVEGHINKLASRAVKLGYNIYDVLMATCINPIQHYNLPLNGVAENSLANFTVVNDLVSFKTEATYIKGELVFDTKSNSTTNNSSENVSAPNFPFRTKHFSSSLDVIATAKKMAVINAIDGELLTKLNYIDNLKLGDEVKIDLKSDLLKIVLLDRYSDTQPIVAFIRGFGLKSGAIAASIAHDSHHILSIGADDENIDAALQWVINSKGGLCFANKGEISGLALPFFGLMCNDNIDVVSNKYKDLSKLVQDNGCVLKSPFMTAAFMALTVIPEVKIYHNGLFDGVNFKPLPLFKE